MRLDKYLADMNVAPRSEAKKMIRKGRITVNACPAAKPEQQVQPADIVCADGREIPYYETEYIMLHKPAGVVSATKDPHDRTVLDLLPPVRRTDLAPAGRLDKDTEGLLLITNDGALAHALLSPKKHVDKQYYAETEGIPAADAVQRFREGMDIGDETWTLPAELEILETDPEKGRARVLVTLREGRFHQVKRMLAACGSSVRYLKRLSFGPLKLDPELAPGRCRHLTEAEIAALKGENF